jgi:hypothetical protein
MADKEEIAQWLINEIRTNGGKRSYQNRLVHEIRQRFGQEWSYTNHNGNHAIDKGVLKEFNKLKDEYVYWERSDQSWRIVTPEQLEAMQSRAARIKERREENARRKAEWEASRSA